LEEVGDDGDFSPRSNLTSAKSRFLQNAVGYAWLNPHLSMTVDWHGERQELRATNANWTKWRPSDPPDPHWYGVAEFERLLGANIAWDADHGRDRTLREFVADFQGLSGSAKVKRLVDSLGIKRAKLADLAEDGSLDRAKTDALLRAMKAQTRPVKAKALGIIGEEHLRASFAAAGADIDTFKYKRITAAHGELPFVVESAFAYRPDASERLMVTGINWSPAVGANPFRELGSLGKSLDSMLEEQRAGEDEPIIFLLHVACPKVTYADRGKSSVIIEDK
jgi:DNA topoisomerase VI subunit B